MKTTMKMKTMKNMEKDKEREGSEEEEWRRGAIQIWEIYYAF
jgi:hypothetical protein